METILIMLYALLSLNTAQIQELESSPEPDQEELARLYDTGDDIRREVQEARNNI